MQVHPMETTSPSTFMFSMFSTVLMFFQAGDDALCPLEMMLDMTMFSTSSCSGDDVGDDALVPSGDDVSHALEMMPGDDVLPALFIFCVIHVLETPF